MGATRFLSGAGGPEGSVLAFGSGGGFSNHFETPPFQKKQVAEYLANHPAPAFHFNSKGRCTPDVAALGIGFSVVVNGQVESIGGTSAAAPTFSAVVALLNAHQLQNGRKPLGYLNQWLYGLDLSAGPGEAPLWDVTDGSNGHGCCSVSGIKGGFQCKPGYDAVTGLGTPNFDALLAALPK